eukprot:COSAG05_NODE_1040_length_6068_cov_46.397219_5_plen_51_part_00
MLTPLYLFARSLTVGAGDELVTMGPGPSNWYENDFYINSMGQGIMVKTLE